MYIRTYKAPVVSEKWLQGLFLISDRHIVGSLGNRPISTIKPLEVQKMLNSLDVSSKLHKNKKDSRLSAGALSVVVL